MGEEPLPIQQHLDQILAAFTLGPRHAGLHALEGLKLLLRVVLITVLLPQSTRRKKPPLQPIPQTILHQTTTQIPPRLRRDLDMHATLDIHGESRRSEEHPTLMPPVHILKNTMINGDTADEA